MKETNVVKTLGRCFELEYRPKKIRTYSIWKWTYFLASVGPGLKGLGMFLTFVHFTFRFGLTLLQNFVPMKTVFFVGEAAFNANQSSAAGCHASYFNVAAVIALLHFYRSPVEI